jgi:hypothetical protein
MKYQKINLILVGFIASTFSYANPLPYKVNTVKEFKSGNISKDLAKYRIVLSESTNSSNFSNSVKNITLCSQKNCYNSPTSKNLNIKNMLDGKPDENSLVYLIPRSEIIKTIYFEPTNNTNETISGNVSIKNPTDLSITELKHDVDIFINLKKDKNSLIPYYASSMFNTSEAKNVFYDNTIGLNSEVDYKTRIVIPKNSLITSQIFNIYVNNDGNIYPSIDIYPKVDFRIPINITRKQINNEITNSLSTILKITQSPSDSKYKELAANDNNTLSINSSGFISSSTLQPNNYSKANISTRAATETCGEYLTRLRTQLISQTSSTGVLKIDYCVDKPPYVHIALINKLHKNVEYMIEHQKTYIDPMDPSSTVFLTPMYKLNFFNNSAPSALVSMNGFTWDGPPGIIANTGGRPLGYVASIRGYNNNTDTVYPIGVNRKMGGTVKAGAYPGPSDGNKFVMLQKTGSPKVSFFDANKVGAALGTSSKGMENVVSSSTSIIKNNVCNSGNIDRWSSVGAIDSVMVMISTASDKESNSADFCTIYRALGITNALRLDGGGSTGMMINNQLLNPNTGSKRVVFGDMRHIPYALKIYRK